MKAVLAVFKSLATLDKTVDECEIELRVSECRFVFTMRCKHGVTRTRNLTYQVLFSHLFTYMS